MKILMASTSPGNVSYGASKIQIKTAEGLEKLGCKVTHIFLEDLPITKRLYRLRFFTAPIEIKFKMIKYQLKYGPYDVIDILSGDGVLAFPTAAILFPSSARFKRSVGLEQTKWNEVVVKRNIAEEKGSFWHFLYFRLFRMLCVRLSVVCAHGVVCNSPYDAKWMAEKKWKKPDEILAVPAGVSRELIKKSSSDDRNPKHLLFMGRWCSWKGKEIVVEVFERLYKEDPSYKLTIAGISASFTADYVMSHFSKHVRQNINVIPKYIEEELPSVAKDAGIFLYPSYFEGFGLVILEAMALGIVPVTWNKYGISCFLKDGVDAELVGENTADEYIARILNLSKNTDRLRNISREAVKTAERMSWENAAEKTLKFYKKFIDEK